MGVVQVLTRWMQSQAGREKEVKVASEREGKEAEGQVFVWSGRNHSAQNEIERDTRFGL